QVLRRRCYPSAGVESHSSRSSWGSTAATSRASSGTSLCRVATTARVMLSACSAATPPSATTAATSCGTVRSRGADPTVRRGPVMEDAHVGGKVREHLVSLIGRDAITESAEHRVERGGGIVGACTVSGGEQFGER